MATSTTSACTVEPSSSSSVVPKSRCWPPVTLRWLRTSHLREAISVKRSPMSSSQYVSNVEPRRIDRHPGAQRGEHVRELGGNETAADDHQMLGHFGDAHDGVAGVNLNPAVAIAGGIIARAPAAITT